MVFGALFITKIKKGRRGQRGPVGPSCRCSGWARAGSLPKFSCPKLEERPLPGRTSAY